MADSIEEYLAADIGPIHIAASCRDVLGVYHENLELSHARAENSTFPGVAMIANQLMSILDLRSRSGLTTEQISGPQHIISFQTSMAKTYAVIVDHIDGLKSFSDGNMFVGNKNLANQYQNLNLNLLFPKIAIDEQSIIYHILDTTYLDKLDPIAEQSGELEMI